MERANVFVGFDNRHPLTYRACVNSIFKQDHGASVYPIVQQVVRAEGLYWRDLDRLASTEFSLTRFLVPFLRPRGRFALFCDGDFLFTGPLDALVNSTVYAQPERAVWVVKHEEEKQRSTTLPLKMEGLTQSFYPRKWWSALVLWDLEHPANRRLTIRDVNDRPPGWLHRFSWLPDEDIGEIDPTWHWLDGYDTPPRHGHPAGIHLTRGTPEMGSPWDKTTYAELWVEFAKNRRSA